MKKVILLGLSIIALISSLLIGATAAVSADAPSSQTWYLNSGPVSPFEMVREDSSSVSGLALIPAHGFQYWIANESALTDVTFPDGSWMLYVVTDSNWKNYVDFKIGSYNLASGVFTPFNTTVTLKGYGSIPGLVQWIFEVNTQSGSEYVPMGDYRALKVFNNHNIAHKIITNGGSTLTSPDSDPGYPLPEIAAGILLGGGLVGLVGFVYMRRKKVHAAV
jgi:hypothetical protein